MTLARRRADARSIFDAGLRAVDPEQAVRDHLTLEDGALTWRSPTGHGRWPLDAGRLRVVGMGKAAAAMARGVEAVVPGATGLVVVKDGHALATRGIEVVEASHPIPDERGEDAARRVEAMLAQMAPADLTIVLISGGGSALLPAPRSGLSLAEKQRVTAELLAAGQDIFEVNRVRQRLSRLKGGGMLSTAGRGHILALILSDVVGDPLQFIASGPTVPPEGEGEPTSGLYCGCRYTNVLVGSNRQCLAACAKEAQRLGYAVEVVTDRLTGEAREVGARLIAEVPHGTLSKGPRARLWGGETTVTVTGDGVGGRNQELALAAALALDGRSDLTLLSGGTDGTDGPTDAAGGVVDGTTAERGRKLGLDARAFLARNDSYHFLAATGDLLKTGPTRTNVMDVQVLLSS